MGGATCIVSWFIARKKGYLGEGKATFARIASTFKECIWALLMPVIILGGIYGGIFTPTEASAVAAVYGAAIGKFVYRELKWKDVPKVLLSAATSTTMIMYVVGAANLFGWILTNAQVPHKIAAGFTAMTDTPWLPHAGERAAPLHRNSAQRLGGGGHPDTYPSAVALSLGIDPVFFGVLMVVNLAIGCITPPVGLDLFVVSSITKISIDKIMRDVMPYLLALIAVLVILTWFPDIILFLPRLLRGA